MSNESDVRSDAMHLQNSEADNAAKADPDNEYNVPESRSTF